MNAHDVFEHQVAFHAAADARKRIRPIRRTDCQAQVRREVADIAWVNGLIISLVCAFCAAGLIA